MPTNKSFHGYCTQCKSNFFIEEVIVEHPLHRATIQDKNPTYIKSCCGRNIRYKEY